MMTSRQPAVLHQLLILELFSLVALVALELHPVMHLQPSLEKSYSVMTAASESFDLPGLPVAPACLQLLLVLSLLLWRVTLLTPCLPSWQMLVLCLLPLCISEVFHLLDFPCRPACPQISCDLFLSRAISPPSL